MKSSRILILMGFANAILYIGVAIILALLWPHVSSTVDNAFHAIAYACQTALQDFTSGQLVFTVFGIGAFIGFIGWTGRTIFLAYRMARRVDLLHLQIPMRVLAIAKDAGLDVSRLRIINESQAFAMTVGVRYPEVVITTQALHLLTTPQLKAVFQHEAHHVQEREPLRRLLLSLALLWVPTKKLRKSLQENYITASEVEADEKVKDQSGLGEALLKMVAPPVAAAGFSPLDARVERLVNPKFYHTGKLAWRFTAFTLLAVISFTFVAPHAIAMVYGDHPSPTTAVHLDMCRIEHERILQSREQNCGLRSITQTCITK